MDEDDLKGVMKYEFNDIEKSGILDFGFQIRAKDGKDYTEWEMVMSAPEDSDYAGGHYLLNVKFEVDYPYENPKIKIITPIYHCNVGNEGELKINWMMRGMKMDYIMPRLLTLFYLQDTSVDENSEKCKLYKKHPDEFKAKIKKNVQEEANKEIKLENNKESI